MTQYEQITQSPETLGAFLAALPVIDGPWDKEFQKRFCAGCPAEDCDACPHAAERNNPGWWLTLGGGGAVERYAVIMHIEISNTGAITFIVDPYAITATKKDLREHDESQTAYKTAFDKKADLTDLNNHVNNSDIHVSHANMENINTAISGLIEHKEDTDVHITPADREAWAAGAAQAAQAAADAAAAL